jgi:hypothetical protein
MGFLLEPSTIPISLIVNQLVCRENHLNEFNNFNNSMRKKGSDCTPFGPRFKAVTLYSFLAPLQCVFRNQLF